MMKHAGLKFCWGGTVYVGLEVLFRRRSHGSMFFAGGMVVLLLNQFRKSLQRLGPLRRALAGTGIITAVELVTGLIWNRDHRIWDYRQIPMNYRGQICLPFSLLWAPLSLAALHLTDQA
jgi:uncharacterized membrane protein